MVLQLEGVQLPEGVLAVLLELALELHSLSVEVVGRVLFPVRGHSRSLVGGLLRDCFLSLLLLLPLLPLLVDLATLGRVLLIDGLDLLLNFAEQKTLVFAIINGLLLGDLFGLNDFALVVV